MGQPKVFGTLPDGTQVFEVALEAGDLSARVITWGAAIRDLRLAKHPAPLVLGLNNLADYVRHSRHFGALTGRCANRIRGGRAVIKGKVFSLERNEGGLTHLHGGSAGFSKRAWQILEVDDASVRLGLVSQPGEAGYPGQVEVEVVYALVPPANLVMLAEAKTDAPTLVNLAHHSYFTLDATGDVRGHELEIAADAITEVDRNLVPTGAVLPVDGSEFDFRRARRIGDAGDAYDINYCLAAEVRAEPSFAARLSSRNSGVTMELHTTEPGLQLYDAARLDVPVGGLDGRRYQSYSGLCLEPQRWPDAINHRHFPSALLQPGELYHQCTEYRFVRE